MVDGPYWRLVRRRRHWGKNKAKRSLAGGGRRECRGLSVCVGMRVCVRRVVILLMS